jgi:hypothetical protein
MNRPLPSLTIEKERKLLQELGALRSIFYCICTLSGCDSGNRTRNIAVYTWRLSLLSYGSYFRNLYR